MITNEQLEALSTVANRVHGKLRNNYSGRGMFGRTCYGIDCDNNIACIEAAAAVGITGAKTDNMGLGWIVYWPNLSDEPQR